MSETKNQTIDDIMDERWFEADDSGSYHGLSAEVDEQRLAKDSINQQALLNRIQAQNQERIKRELNEVKHEKPELDAHLTDPKRHSIANQKVQTKIEP